jgi:hypothetical protein
MANRFKRGGISTGITQFERARISILVSSRLYLDIHSSGFIYSIAPLHI